MKKLHLIGVMNTAQFLFLILPLLLGLSFVYAEQPTCVYFFYGNGCQFCTKAEPIIEQLEVKYPYLNIQKFEIYDNRKNAAVLNSFFDA